MAICAATGTAPEDAIAASDMGTIRDVAGNNGPGGEDGIIDDWSIRLQ